ncbi:hypothetical protein B0H11DRAFT_1929736 [Mycena galericulata]|nr:hypothetical protein B0H11DRAFT_1929736 [Mycena galericulata]
MASRTAAAQAPRRPLAVTHRASVDQLPPSPPPQELRFIVHSLHQQPLSSPAKGRKPQEQGGKRRSSETDNGDTEALVSKRARMARADLVVDLPASERDPAGNRILVPINIGQLYKNDLTKKCEGYGLPFTQKSSRGDLVCLLQEYSKKKDWSNLESQSSQSHKGQRDDSAPTKLTQLRNKAIADGTITLPPPPVDEIVRENPMLPPEERRPPQPKSDVEWKEEIASRVAGTQDRVNSMYPIIVALGAAVGLALPPPSTSNLPSPSTSNLPSSSTSALPSPSTSALPSPSTSTLPSSSTNNLPSSSASALLRPDSQPLNTPSLGSPVLFPGRQDIPLPPNDGFLSYDPQTALAKIMKHWDPERPEWDPEHDWFQHRGSFVALNQYPQLYKHTEFWQDHSVSECIALGGQAAFWNRYQHPDKSLWKLSEIYEALTIDKKDKAAEIRRLFTPQEFADKFSYIAKGGSRTVMTRPSSIIDRYNKLQRR